MRIIDASKTSTLVLGYQGEDQRLVVRFPLADEKTGRKVTEEFPGGSFTVSVMLPDDESEYIVSSADLQLTENWLEWTVKEPYTVGRGEGKVQLNYAFGGMVKSRIWKTSVKKSISTGSGTVPSWSDWKTELLTAANAVQQAVESYDEMTAAAEDGDQTSAHIDRTGDHPVLHIVIKNNGGGGGADIDDDHTRRDKTWSSKKISDELDTKADEEDLSSLSETIVKLPFTKYVEKVVTVKTDGTGDFTSIRAAIESITDASKSNPYRIEVYPGTYNVLADYTDEEIRAAGEGSYLENGMVGPKLTDGMSIRGIGRTQDIILNGYLDPSTFSAAVRGNISTLNIQGNGRIENLTIKAEYIRYCVHDDFPYSGATAWREVRDCVFEGHKISYNPPTTYGAGQRGTLCGIFSNCDFNGNLGIHSSPSTIVSPLTITIENCRGNRLIIGDQNTTEPQPGYTFIVNNCNFKMLVINKASGVLNQHCSLDGVGNENSMIKCPSGFVYSTGAVQKIVYDWHTQFSVGDVLKMGGDGFFPTKTTDPKLFYGIVIGKTSSFHYIQTEGWVNSDTLGLTGLSAGDRIGIDANSAVTKVADDDEAIGLVTFIDSDDVAHIRLGYLPAASAGGVPCTGITLNVNTLDLTSIGGTATLTATPTPADTTDSISWSTSDSSVATVADGVVTAVGLGTATITVTCGNQTATCAVAVDNVVPDYVMVAGYSPSKRAADTSNPSMTTNQVTSATVNSFIIAADKATGLYPIESKTTVDTSPYRFVPILIPAGATKIKLTASSYDQFYTRFLWCDSTKQETIVNHGAWCVQGVDTGWDQPSRATNTYTITIPTGVSGLDSFCAAVNSSYNTWETGTDYASSFSVEFLSE